SSRTRRKFYAATVGIPRAPRSSIWGSTERHERPVPIFRRDHVTATRSIAHQRPPGRSTSGSSIREFVAPGLLTLGSIINTKEVPMIRVLAVVVAVLLSISLGVTGTMAQMKTDPAQPKMEQKSDKMGHKVEGTIKSVRGNIVTREDGPQLSIPSSTKVDKDQLK